MVMRSTVMRNADIGRYSIVELMNANGDFVQVDTIEESFSAKRLDTYEREY
jgi:carbonic anhydrase/acetyltransferase-like protein (isoleucine patch superfamily)